MSYKASRTHKTCPGCQQHLPVTEYPPGRCAGGINSYCKECFRTKNRLAATRNRKSPEARRAEYQANAEEMRAKARERYHRNPEAAAKASRKWWLKKKYGLTLEQYDQMLSDQGGGCAICGGKESRGYQVNFHVDHDHATGAVRGLLCAPCNTAIGLLQDDHEVVLRAALYLDR